MQLEEIKWKHYSVKSKRLPDSRSGYLSLPAIAESAALRCRPSLPELHRGLIASRWNERREEENVHGRINRVLIQRDQWFFSFTSARNTGLYQTFGFVRDETKCVRWFTLLDLPLSASSAHPTPASLGSSAHLSPVAAIRQSAAARWLLCLQLPPTGPPQPSAPRRPPLS